MNWRCLSVTCLLFTLLQGCEHSLNPDLSRQVTDAIAAINEFNRVADRTPENIRAAAEKIINKLKLEGNDVLANDARYFVDHTLGNASTVPKGTITYLDEKMKAYLNALKKALEDTLPKIKAEKSRDKAIELLQNIKIDVKQLDPFIELVNPNKLTVHLLQTHTGQARGLEYSSPRLVEMFGFGFLRPDGEPTDYTVKVLGRGTRQIPATVSAAGPFVATLNLSNFYPVEGDRELRVYWGEKKLAEVAFEKIVVRDPSPTVPPLSPLVDALLINVETTKDDKDAGVRFVYILWRDREGDRYGDIAQIEGGYDLWRNGDKRTIKLSIPVEKRFLESERYKYKLKIRYESKNGQDPKWEGNYSVDALIQGKDKPMLGIIPNTGDFEMGHYKGGIFDGGDVKYPGLKDREFLIIR